MHVAGLQHCTGTPWYIRVEGLGLSTYLHTYVVETLYQQLQSCGMSSVCALMLAVLLAISRCGAVNCGVGDTAL